eukprot:5180555-Prymnesium_polylepis.1
MGSILFIVGATASALSPRFSHGWVDVHGDDDYWRRTYASGEQWEWEWKATILIQYAYLIGGCYFTVGVKGCPVRAVRAARWHQCRGPTSASFRAGIPRL